MNLSPTARWLLGGLVAALTAFSASLPLFTGLPDWVGPALAVVVATLGALGIIPPQTGGTQQGVVNPTLDRRTPPAPTTYEPSKTQGSLGFWPVAALTIGTDRVDSGETLFWIGILVVVACIAAAIVALFRLVPPTNYAVAVGCLIAALVAGVLLL